MCLFSVSRVRRALNIIVAGVAAGVLSGLPAGAQSRASSSDNELLLLGGEQTVVTASKRAQKVSDVPAAVTVITEEQIRASGATNILDLLRYVPGLDVSELNRAAANVSIRGFNTTFANRLLVMVDNRPVYSDFFGGVFWTEFPVLMLRIKRIEIVRGPGSALYGANAFNGVINVITKTPAELAKEPAKTEVRSLLGEQASALNEIVTSLGKPKDWSLALGAGYNRSGGFGARQPNQARDSFLTPLLTLDVEKRLKRGDLRLALGNSEATVDLSQSVILPDTRIHTSFAHLVYEETSARNPLTVRAFDNVIVGLGGLQDTQVYEVEVQQSRALGTRHSLIYGASYRYVNSNPSPLTLMLGHNQTLWAGYLQDEWRLAKQTRLFAGFRYDHHSLYGSNFSPRVSLLQHLPSRQTLRLSYSSSFRAPTLIESYVDQTLPLVPGLDLRVLGNRNLKPEHINGYELGYRKELRGGHLAASLYYNQITDLIASAFTSFAPSPPYPPFTPTTTTFENVGASHAVGLELAAELPLAKNVRGLFNYAYEDAEGNNGARTDLTPQHKVNVAIQARLSRQWDAYLGGHFVGASYIHSSASILQVNPYTRVDARLGYHLGTKARPWVVSLVATNLFDDRHLEYPLFSQSQLQAAPSRRTLYITAQGKF